MVGKWARESSAHRTWTSVSITPVWEKACQQFLQIVMTCTWDITYNSVQVMQIYCIVSKLHHITINRSSCFLLYKKLLHLSKKTCTPVILEWPHKNTRMTYTCCQGPAHQGWCSSPSLLPVWNGWCLRAPPHKPPCLPPTPRLELLLDPPWGFWWAGQSGSGWYCVLYPEEGTSLQPETKHFHYDPHIISIKRTSYICAHKYYQCAAFLSTQ